MERKEKLRKNKEEKKKKNEEQKENVEKKEQCKRKMEGKKVGEEEKTRIRESLVVVDLLEPQNPKVEEAIKNTYEEVRLQGQLEWTTRTEEETVECNEIGSSVKENCVKLVIMKRASLDLASRNNLRQAKESTLQDDLILINSPKANLTSENHPGTRKLLGNDDTAVLGPLKEKEQFECHQSFSMQSASMSHSVLSEEPGVSPENTVKQGREMGCLHTDRAIMNPSETRGPCGDPVDSSPYHNATDRLPSKSQVFLPDSAEQKRLKWMNACIPWSKIAMSNNQRHQGRKAAVIRGPSNRLPPVGVDTVLQTGTWSSLKQVTTVTLEDLPACSLSTLSECMKLQKLTLRRCGLVALEGISECKDLRYIDVQENSIKFINCQDLVNLQVLLLNHNQLTSIHGLESATKIGVLELSHNRISRISGLETLTRLERLVIDHNQLISTKGLGGVCTLLHLDCACNHLSSLDEIDDCVLLGTLRLQGNNLSEPPCLSDHVLMRKLHLDDNSLMSLHSLTACWLPLLQHLSASQNSITDLPLLSDFVSLRSLDVSHNCLSDLPNVQLALRGCQHLQDINVRGNPFQQDTNWRSTLLEAVPGLKKIDGEWIGMSRASSAEGEGQPPAWSLLGLCGAQIEQLERAQWRQEKRPGASSRSATLSVPCGHNEGLLNLAVECRSAHERGDFSFTHGAETEPQSCRRTGGAGVWHQEDTQGPEGFSQGRDSPAQVKAAITDSRRDGSPSEQDHLSPGSGVVENKEIGTCGVNCMLPPCDSLRHSEKTHQHPQVQQRPQLLLHRITATVAQHQWSKYRHQSVNGTTVSGGQSWGCSEASLDREWAATLIQAVWRGYSLRKKLAVALASAQISEGEEDFDEVDMDEFAFDEAALDEDWLSVDSRSSSPHLILYSDWLSVDTRSSSPRLIQHSDWLSVDTRSSSPRLIQHSDWLPWPKPSSDHAKCDSGTPVLLPKPRDAWASASTGQETETLACLQLGFPPRNTLCAIRKSQTPPAGSHCGLSEMSETILQEWGITDKYTAHLMLKRAQKMRPNKQHRKLLDEINCSLACHQLHGDPIASHARPASADRGHFLPEIDLDVRNGRRVQLVAGPGSRDGPDQEWASGARGTASSLRRKEHNQARRHSVGHLRRAVPVPVPVAAVAAPAPSRKERLSFRDKPTQLSGGWGGGKRRPRQGK